MYEIQNNINTCRFGIIITMDINYLEWVIYLQNKYKITTIYYIKNY